MKREKKLLSRCSGVVFSSERQKTDTTEKAIVALLKRVTEKK